jgi:hypothetical protein
MISNLVKYRTKKDTFLLVWSAIVFFCLGWFICYKAVSRGPCPSIPTPTDTATASSKSADGIVRSSTETPFIKSTAAIATTTTVEAIDQSPHSPTIYDKLNEIENSFEKTIRSCLGAKCFDEAVNGVDRIGILAPSRSGGEIIANILRSRQSNDKASIVYDTHVPAYGYGKNHGWTRIIRIVRPLVDHSLSLINHQPIADEEIEAQVR